MKKLTFLAIALMIAVSLLPHGRAAEAGQPADHPAEATLAPAEACLRKVVWLNFRLSGQLKARWYNILNFCYDGVEITDWQLRWRPAIYSPEWRYVRLIGPRVTGNPFRAMVFQTTGVFRGVVNNEGHAWLATLWQRAFPDGRWTFGGRQEFR
jgi:hypothetical protein